MKAVVLLSGGLDSSLALKLIADQGIEVTALHFISSFCRCDGSDGCGSSAKLISGRVGVELKILHLGQRYLEVVKNPRYGYGKNMNPCIDCRILKFQIAKEVMQAEGASFIVTGEVIGQRPMSQVRRMMELIERRSGLKDFIVRPLSAKLLEPSFPEREGWVDREKFMDFSGRTRKPQIELAENLGIKDYPCPAGGCLLTDAFFARRLKDLLSFDELNLHNAELLKIGRHFRFPTGTKIIVGRDENENNRLMNFVREGDAVFEPVSLPGPSALMRGKWSEPEKFIGAQIISKYTATGKQVEVSIKVNGKQTVQAAENIPQDKLEELRV